MLHPYLRANMKKNNKRLIIFLGGILFFFFGLGENPSSLWAKEGKNNSQSPINPNRGSGVAGSITGSS